MNQIDMQILTIDSTRVEMGDAIVDSPECFFLALISAYELLRDKANKTNTKKERTKQN